MSTSLDVGVLLILLGVLVCITAAIVGGMTRPSSYAPRAKASRSLTLVHHAPATPFLRMEHAGATADWSPIAHVAQADTREAILAAEADRERRELATARAELKPLIDDMHTALGAAFAAFDAATLQASRTAEMWHTLNIKVCNTCGEQHARTFGPARSDPTHTIIRAFRIDTPTGEIPILQLS